MPAKVKICGLDREEAVDATVDAGAAMAGFVFYEPSPRNLPIEDAAKLIRRVPASVEIIGLFVNPDDALVTRVLDQTDLDVLQLHGDESPARIEELKTLTGLPVIKVLKIAQVDDLDDLQPYESVAERFLFDARAPEEMEKALPGGNALSFDWRFLAGRDWAKLWILAGGLTAENVAEAMCISGAEAVDVSSGVEDKPGVKNVRKIKAFIEAVATV